MKILVLGCGAQGSAAAFHLLQKDDVSKVIVADVAVDEPPSFLQPWLGNKLELRQIDAEVEARVLETMKGMDVVACALPYYLNLPMTRLALKGCCNFCDLGGNTEIVAQQKALGEEAVRRGVSVIPDCGVAPGMVNILAAAGIAALETIDTVKIRVGGLPQHPEPPLNYQIVYSLHGVIDYMTTPAMVLRDYELAWKEPLTGLETCSFPEPVGDLEAFFTAGGISTLPVRYQGRVREMDYKTLRYPGHAHIMLAIRELGLLDTETVRVGDCDVTPRQAFVEIATPRLRKPGARDLVALTVEVVGRKGGEPRKIRYTLVDTYDTTHSITAMMRTTGYSLASVALMQADGRIPPGVHTPDECVPADDYIAELATEGLEIERVEGPA